MRRSPMPRPTKPMRRSAFKKKKPKHAATKTERQYMGRVASLFCVVCRNLGYGETTAEVHHLRSGAGGGQRSGHKRTIPLCPMHHRLGGYGVAFHAGPEIWEARYGTEETLLAQIIREMAPRRLQ